MKLFLKAHIGLACILLPTFATAKKISYPCSGVPGVFHTNPDSTQGGFVANTASVDSSVTITSEASVCDMAGVFEGATISDRSAVSGYATIRGKVHLAGQAKVYGYAYLINVVGDPMLVTNEAQVYGHGFLQGSVILEGSSQVYGWGKVLDFAQLIGNSKVCGSYVVKNNTVLTDDTSNCL